MPDKRASSPDSYKLVYFGPAGAGKRTNLTKLQERFCAPPLPPTDGNSVLTLSLASVEPVLSKPVSIWTITGGVLDTSPLWTPLLKGVHGVVFVADSNIARFSENLRAMTELIGKLSYYRLKLDNFPVVVQYNKRDLENVVSIDKMEDELNPLGLPAFSTIAASGTGVVECAQVICHLIKKLSGV